MDYVEVHILTVALEKNEYWQSGLVCESKLYL